MRCCVWVHGEINVTAIIIAPYPMDGFPYFIAQDSSLINQSHSSVQEKCVGSAVVKSRGSKGSQIISPKCTCRCARVRQHDLWTPVDDTVSVS